VRKIELESRVLDIVSRVKARQLIEDMSVELKATWTKPEQAARRLAGQANAARGELVLWTVGLDEKSGVCGAALTDEIACEGARRMLVAALETEVAAYLEAHHDERDDAGHALVVRNGKGRRRKITVGAGTIPVNAPRVNDRRTDQDGERRRFASRILPPYMRRSPKVVEVVPVLYLRGLSTGDFREAHDHVLARGPSALRVEAPGVYLW
jgi:hypothetical protein